MLSHFFLTSPLGSRYLNIIIPISQVRKQAEILHKTLKGSWLVSSFRAGRLSHSLYYDAFYPKQMLQPQARKILQEWSGRYRRRGTQGAHCSPEMQMVLLQGLCCEGVRSLWENWVSLRMGKGRDCLREKYYQQLCHYHEQVIKILLCAQQFMDSKRILYAFRELTVRLKKQGWHVP